MRDNYVLQSFLEAPKIVLGSILLIIAAAVAGHLCLLTALAWADGQWLPFIYLPEIPFEILFDFGFGAISGYGLIFLCLDFWWIFRLRCKDEPPMTFFFAIMGNQVALGVCAYSIRRDFPDLLIPITLAGILLFLSYYNLRKRVRAKLTEL